MMTRRPAGCAALCAAMMLTACQSYRAGPQTAAIDGRWTTTDGVYVARLRGRHFKSQIAKSGYLVGEGTFTVEATTISLRWPTDNPQHSATCTITSSSTLHCEQEGQESDWKRL